MTKAKEMDGTSVISGSEASEVLEAVEAALDTIAQPVSSGIVRDDNPAGAIARYDSFRAHLSDKGT